jgi:hypothetical protein
MERKYDHNSRVIYVDPQGTRHEALVTAWWNGLGADYAGSDVFGSPRTAPDYAPGCNLLFMSKDQDKKDNYGRQLERATSVPHKSAQVAAANFWCWPDELT